MRKRRYGLQTAILGAAVLMMLTGCGKKEQSEKDQALEYYQNELELDAKDAQDLADAIYGDGSTAGQKTEETQDVNYEHFDADPGWKDVTPSDYAIQIDDVLYVLGENADDFIKQVESSSVEYTYDYNPDKLEQAGSLDDIMILRNGKEWIRARVENVTDETTGLSECIVYSVQYADKNNDDTVKQYCHFIDGRSYEDILAMTYSDVSALGEGIFSGWKKDEGKQMYTSANGNWEEIIIEYSADSWTRLERAKYTGYSVTIKADYKFTIDPDTSKVIDFSLSGFPMAMVELYVPTPITQFSEMTQEEQNQLIQEAENAVKDKYECTDIALVGSCLQQGKTVNYIDQGVQLETQNLCNIFELTKSDGTKKYVDCELNHTARLVNEEMYYKDIYVGDEYDSVESVIGNHNLRERITDSTLPQ